MVRGTHHFYARCRERGLPAGVARVVHEHGRRERAAKGGFHYRVSPVEALRLHQGGVDVWAYVDIVLVVSDQGLAVTAYRLDDGGRRR